MHRKQFFVVNFFLFHGSSELSLSPLAETKLGVWIQWFMPKMKTNKLALSIPVPEWFQSITWNEDAEKDPWLHLPEGSAYTNGDLEAFNKVVCPVYQFSQKSMQALKDLQEPDL